MIVYYGYPSMRMCKVDGSKENKTKVKEINYDLDLQKFDKAGNNITMMALNFDKWVLVTNSQGARINHITPATLRSVKIKCFSIWLKLTFQSII
jgi:hypothetical protein